MKRSTLIKAAGILAAVIALALIIWFSAFYRADEIRVTDGKLEGVRQTWLVASFPVNGEKAYRKLADVSAPRELSQVKDAPDTDGDPLTTFFVFEGKAGTAYEGYRVTVEGLEGGAQGTPHSAAGAEGLISETDGGIVFDMPSPYSEAVIRLTVTAPEGAAKDTALACLDAAAAKVTPGKKLSALAADFKLNFISFDEVIDQSTDDNAMREMLEMIRGMVPDIGCAFVITHRGGVVRDLFDYKLEVKNNGAYSRLGELEAI